jgi:hypothetical protein
MGSLRQFLRSAPTRGVVNSLPQSRTNMKTNIGSFDAGARFLTGLVILDLSFHGLGWWGLLGIIPIMTGIVGYCPCYDLFHIDTQRWEDEFEKRHPHHH